MTLGDPWADAIPLSHRKALREAAEILTDAFLHEFEAIASGEIPFADSTLGSFLPPKHSLRYTPVFAKRFFVCLLAVTWKLAQRHPPTPLLSCTAEELALFALTEQAKVSLEMAGVVHDFHPFREVVYEDFDYELLYPPALDGVEASQLSEVLGMQSLQFDSWFETFDTARSEVHPYAADATWSSDTDKTSE